MFYISVVLYNSFNVFLKKKKNALIMIRHPFTNEELYSSWLLSNLLKAFTKLV